jgi:hypothetical protein
VLRGALEEVEDGGDVAETCDAVRERAAHLRVCVAVSNARMQRRERGRERRVLSTAARPRETRRGTDAP